jgi:short-subunit dehydrogenase
MAVELSGARVLLTGASGGIGEAIARALHARGAQLVISARRKEVLAELADGLGERVEVLPCDLTREEDVLALAAGAGGVDVLVANAALPASGRLEVFSHEEIDRAIRVNLGAPVQLTRALAPPMVERGRGHLVFISSMAGKVASPGGALYSATKFGVRGFSLAMREDLAGTGVGCTTVFPGFVRDAGMFADSKVELPRGVGSNTPADVAAAVIKGIEKNKAEIDVAPLAVKVSGRFAGVAPTVVGAAQRRLGAAELSEKMSRGQADKR